MTCQCTANASHSAAERQTIRVALSLNATMFFVGITAGLFAQSTAVLADALDMGTDAIAYALALAAISRSDAFKRNAARWTGGTLMLLGMAVVAEVIRRFVFGSEPSGGWMMTYAGVAFCVNVFVLMKLSKFKRGEVHLRASYICTRADVIANMAVFVSGVIVTATGLRVIDLVAGFAIGVYVLKEAWEILEDAGHESEVRDG